MRKGQRTVDRELRLEILRARAALERQGLKQALCELGNDLSPSSLASSVIPRFSARSVLGWATQAVALTRRYPLITSAASTLLSGVGRGRTRWLRVAVGLLISWQLSRRSKS